MMRKVYLLFMVMLAGKAAASQGIHAKDAPARKPTPMIGRYPLTWSSLPHRNVPKGRTFAFMLKNTNIFPDTQRIITVYVPAKYNAKTPACVMVSLDGWGPSTVCDSLIFKKRMPVIIGIGVSCGVTPPAGVGKLTTAQYQRMVSWGPVPIIQHMKRGTPKYIAQASPGPDGMAFGPGGRLYVTEPTDNRVVAFSPNGKLTVTARGIHGSQLVVTRQHDVYVAGSTGRSWRSGCHRALKTSQVGARQNQPL